MTRVWWVLLNALGVVLVVSTAVAAFFTEWFGVFGAAAAVCFIVAGLLTAFEQDCGYSDTVHVRVPAVYTRAAGYPLIEGGRDPLHRGPQAYPLTHRPVWDPDVFGAPE